MNDNTSSNAAHATPLAVRKQLLIARAAVQREALATQLAAARVGPFGGAGLVNGLAALAPRLFRWRFLPGLWGVLRRFPAIGAAISVVLARLRSPLLRYAVLGAGVGWMLWKLLRTAQQPNAHRAQAPAAARASRQDRARETQTTKETSALAERLAAAAEQLARRDKRQDPPEQGGKR